MKTKIAVKQSHINNGTRCRSSHCPVALAVSDAFDLPFDLVGVTRDYIRVDDCRYKTPEEARAFIRNFDGGDKVEPFEFELGETW